MNKRTTWLSIIVIFLVTAVTIILRPVWKPLFFGEPTLQTTTYRLPHAYALTYPKGWRRYDGSEKEGYEILSIYSYNYRKVTDPGSGFGGGQIKIALSILPRANQGQQPLAEIVKSEFKGTEKNFTQQVLTIHERQAIRVTAVVETEEASSPVIETFIEYKSHQYAWLVGYYDGSISAAQEIIKVQDSFQALE
ncbi:MAG TPA: hypothetical protein VHY08_18240 [Bacillota bacterium]|nr:hypothetical protein [Bacillota bacterium]